jgi:hypothetical protein
MKTRISNKKRLIKDFENLDKSIKEQIKLAYPDGFSDYLISFKNSSGEDVSALPFETEDSIYLVKMSVRKARLLIEMDDDFDESGNLKDDIREKYEDEYNDDDNNIF